MNSTCRHSEKMEQLVLPMSPGKKIKVSHKNLNSKPMLHVDVESKWIYSLYDIGILKQKLNDSRLIKSLGASG